MAWGLPAVLGQAELGVRGGGGVCGGAHLQGDVGLGPDLGGGQFHVGVLAHEVDGDELLAARAGEARGAAAGGLLLHHDALRPILALVLVAGAGLQQDHGRGVLAEEPAGGGGRQVFWPEPEQRGVRDGNGAWSLPDTNWRVFFLL